MQTVKSYLLSTGKYVDDMDPISKRVQMTNIISIVLAGCTLLYGILFYLVKIHPLDLLTLPLALMYLSVVFMNLFGAYGLSRAFLLLVTNCAIYFYSVALGEVSNTHFWFITSAVMTYVIYDLDELRFIIPSLMLSCVLLMTLLFSEFRSELIPTVVLSAVGAKIIATLMIFFAFAVCSGIVYFVILDYRSIRRLNFHSKNIIENHMIALNASSIIAHTDANGVITYVNDTFCRISKYSRSELIGETHSILNSGQHPPEFFKEMWRTITSKKVWHGEICNKAKDGTFYWVKTTIVPIMNEDKQIEGYVAVRQDITRNKKNEAALANAAKMASLGEMAGGIAHEINNPLAIIQGKSSQLLRSLDDNQIDKSRVREVLEVIISNTTRMSNIIKGLRSFSRDGSKDEMVPVKLEKIVLNCLNLISERMNKNQIELIVGKIPDVEIDCIAVQIEQVLINLLGNAFDAVLPLEKKWIKIEFMVNSERVHVIVTDSGRGIEPKIADKIMQPFFTTKPPGKGTGLGLSISKGIVEAHKGVFFYDGSCMNTRFIIDLPIAR